MKVGAATLALLIMVQAVCTRADPANYCSLPPTKRSGNKCLMAAFACSSPLSLLARHHHSATNPFSARITQTTRLQSSRGESLMEVMSSAVAKSLGREEVRLEPTRTSAAGGGGGASVSAAKDAISGDKFFIKTARGDGKGGQMLQAEYLGIKEMSDTNTIRVPKPIAYGQGGPTSSAFVVFEYLDIGGSGSGYELGINLAKMHKVTSSNNMFGFHVDNTIGATPQPNLPWMEDWAEFWDTHRLGHMLQLTGNVGHGAKQIETLRAKTKELLSSHNPQPSLLHGDLWGGNKGYAKIDGKQVPVIFDPATYYGDREADVAMTYVFGGFGSDFYEGYESEWPLSEGHEKRRTIYNLYHILNHYVLFGGGYRSQAKGMIEQILRM